MYQKIKHVVFFAVYALLWARFFTMLWDPYWGGLSLSDGLPIYTSWRAVFDLLYGISGYLMIPVYMLYSLVDPFIPDMPYFPGIAMATAWDSITTAVLSNPALADKSQLMQSPVMQQTMAGYADFLVIITMVFFRLLNPLLDLLADFFKNLVWNVLIEFSFTKRKESRYQEALEKRAADLMKLNVEYKNLSKEANMLAQSVITDELTKVYNKRFFLEKITQEFKTAKDKKNILAVAMVDIDHFKKLNDNYGHLMGDKVLKAVAQVAKGNTPNGCFCCRFGGEEFSIIMPGKTLDEAHQIISRIHQSLPLLRFEDDASLRTSASFGICVADFKTSKAQAMNSFEDMLKLADDQLYQAKLNGRNRIEHVQVNDNA